MHADSMGATSPCGSWSCENGGPRARVGASHVVTLDAFVDFALTGGLARLELSKPAHWLSAIDFYEALRPALREAHQIGRLEDIRWRDTGDMRRERIFPRVASGYAAAVRKAEARFLPCDPRMLHAHPVDILVEPIGLWTSDRGGDPIAVFLHFDVQRASARRISLYLAAARLVGFHGGFVDLQDGGALTLGAEPFISTPDASLRCYFEAEARAFAELRSAQ